MATAASAGEAMKNAGFEGSWQPLKSETEGATATGRVPDQWGDVSTWSGASTVYTRIPARDGRGHALRLELVKASQRHSVLQLRSAFPVRLAAGKAYQVRAWLRSPDSALVYLDIRQHMPPRIRFWRAAVRPGAKWREHRFVLEPRQSGEARFFVLLRSEGVVEVDDLSLRELADHERPAPPPPLAITGARCVPTRGPVLRRSDVIAMYHEHRPAVIRKYRLDVIAWGGQLRPDPQVLSKRRAHMEAARAAGVRLHAVDCAMAQEGGRAVVSECRRGSPHGKLFWQLRKDNAGTIKQLADLGVDLRARSALALDGSWCPVPWLRKRWRIPLASVYSSDVRQWFLGHMDAIASTGLTALHFDEPGMGAYGLLDPEPGDFSPAAMAAFRQWLAQRPAQVWQAAGIESLDGFDYGEFIKARGGAPKRAPLWREFVRFQLFTTVDHVRELRDRVRERVGRPIPLSMNANASSWLKLPFLELQDFATTEVAHEAKSRRPPTAPLLVYKLGDALRQPVASTAHGSDWYEMKVDQHPVLVSNWIATAYALGHHMMNPYRAWVMDPVKGSDSYRATTDHYACMAQFIKHVARLLDGYEAVSVLCVALGCDAIQHRALDLRALARRLADGQVPFCLAVEGNDLLARRISADDLEGCAAVLVAAPELMSREAVARLTETAGDRPVLEYLGGPLPSQLPKPIEVAGAAGLWVLPRVVPGDSTAAVAVHLLNRDYDPSRRAMVAKSDFTVKLDRKLFAGRSFSKAVLHQPRLSAELKDGDPVATAQDVSVKQTASYVEIRVPRLDVWGIVELR